MIRPTIWNPFKEFIKYLYDKNKNNFYLEKKSKIRQLFIKYITNKCSSVPEESFFLIYRNNSVINQAKIRDTVFKKLKILKGI